MKAKTELNEAVLGGDMHPDMHVDIVAGRAGNVLGTLAAMADHEGYLKLMNRARSLGTLMRAGVE